MTSEVSKGEEKFENGAFQLAHEIYLLENSAGITKRQKVTWRRQLAVTLNPVQDCLTLIS